TPTPRPATATRSSSGRPPAGAASTGNRLRRGKAPPRGNKISTRATGRRGADPPLLPHKQAPLPQQPPTNGRRTRAEVVGAADGNDQIVNASSGEVLDDPAFSTSNGTLIQQYQLNGGTNQQWKIVALSNGNDEVFNAYSGKVLDDPAFSTSNGTLIQQYQLN